MKTYFLTGALVLLFSVSASAQTGRTALTELLSHPNRPAEDAQRDQARQPVQTLAFAGVGKGQHVLDLFAGSGWYTELLSHAVGSEGKVYAHNDEVIWRFAEKGINARMADNRLPNVVRFDKMAIVDIEVPPNSLDLVFTALNYHDLFFTQSFRDGVLVTVRDEIVDYRKALAHIKAAMKDDGVFVIIDHIAKPGSGYDAANTVHRIDPDIVKYQMEEAGFVLLEESFHLRNDQDDHSKNVFDASVRGATDRFAYKFVKQK